MKDFRMHQGDSAWAAQIYRIYNSDTWMGMLKNAPPVSRRLWWPHSVKFDSGRNTAAASDWLMMGVKKHPCFRDREKSQGEQSHCWAARWKCVWRMQPQLNNMCLFVCDTSCITETGEKMWGRDASTFGLLYIWKGLQTSPGKWGGYSGERKYVLWPENNL